MAVRFDSAADRLLRTADLLNYNAAYTWMFWLYMVVDQNAITVPAALFRDTGNVDDVRTSADGTTIGIRARAGGVGGQVAGSALSTGTWYHVAMVRESATSLKLYLNGVLDAEATQDVSARNPITRMELGAESASDSNPFNGRVAYIKTWDTNLSLAEIAVERWTIAPRRLANLRGFWPTFPGATERLRDYSGNGRNWTESGTLTDEDPPPVSWGAPSLAVISQASVVVSGAAALSGAGALQTSALVVVRGQAALSGVGDLAGVGLVIVAAAASLSGAGGLSALASLVIPGAAGLSGAGALTVSGRVIVRGAAVLTGQGAMSLSVVAPGVFKAGGVIGGPGQSGIVTGPGASGSISS